MNNRAVGLALLPFLAVLGIAACSSGPAPLTVHGTVEVDLSVGTADPYSDGTQVVVYNSSNQVIGTGTLAASKTPNPLSGQLGLLFDSYTFTVSVPGGLPRYGIEVGGQHGIVWESPAQMKAGPGLDLQLDG